VNWVEIDVDRDAEDLDHLISPEDRLLVAMAIQWSLHPWGQPRRPQGRSSPVMENQMTEERNSQEAPATVRRNEPCPCGSGRKSKLCHGRT
jgi:hypothetical protein